MGSAFAAFLADAGHEVLLVGRGGTHIEAVAATGLLVRPPEGVPYRAQVVACTHASQVDVGSVDVLIVLTKAFDTAAAARAAAHVLAPGGVAVSLQNGLGNDRVLADTFGAERALVGVTTVGAARQEPGEISISPLTAQGSSQTHLGATRLATGSARGAEVAALLTAARLPAEHVEDIEKAIWEKLAMAVMSPVSAVLGSTVGNLWRHDAGRELVRSMFDEVISVARSEGVGVEAEAAWRHSATTYQGTGEHYTSMCTDVMKGRPTELHSMAAEVARLGAAHGLSLPVHDVVLKLLRVLDVE
jgi:2-dehydropantoate 2-reductase